LHTTVDRVSPELSTNSDAFVRRTPDEEEPSTGVSAARVQREQSRVEGVASPSFV
jgi:hypothetical protein